MKNKFRFFAPVDTFEKGSNEKGDEVYKVRGIISDESFDTDGESLAEDGLDFSEFNWINWDHKKEPKFLIGEPVGVKHVPGKGHFMEGELYSDSEVAKQAIDLMKILQKSKRKNKLSWSVEGHVLERDLLNPKKVKKAKITAVALCPSPKNGNTWAELVQKGFSDECYQKPEDLEYEVNGGEVKLIDEIDGETVTVDKEGNISIDKAQSTQNSSALIKEDVEGNEKKLEKGILTKKIEIIYKDGGGKLEDLLNYIQSIGNIGHGFSIVVDPGDSEFEKSFYWDGDGADRISSIKTSEVEPEDLKKALITISNAYKEGEVGTEIIQKAIKLKKIIEK